ncbi:MAG TPA: RHS repeat-associated core domain-containing protein [Nitrososphaerales archaeon]|nr:RHS repeat-associated core domain-containing protein [Nitrososphaerales archaeon]
MNNSLIETLDGGTPVGQPLTETNSHDVDGNRVKQVAGSSTFTYSYQGLNILYEKNVTGGTTTVTKHFYAGGLQVAKLAGSTVYYLHQDALGSTRLVATTSVTIKFSSNYVPYGNNYGISGKEVFMYTGKSYDSATGLCYYGARYYDPNLGRFVTQDSKFGRTGDPQSLNLYSYCRDNPLKLVDPNGHDWWNPFTWSAPQQAIAITVVVDVVAVAAVVSVPLTCGATAAVAKVAVGAAIQTTAYTIANGNQATATGALANAAVGALGVGVGSAIAGATFASSLISSGLQMAGAATTSVLGPVINAAVTNTSPNISPLSLLTDVALSKVPLAKSWGGQIVQTTVQQTISSVMPYVPIPNLMFTATVDWGGTPIKYGVRAN